MCRSFFVALVASTIASTAIAQEKPRARDLGVPFEGVTGALNAITDVAGVRVGHTTLISGQGPLRVGHHQPMLP
ncbi:MAG: hypothetical protein IH968_15990 [Gemmatimonadetes bacterium]|nr:hypothetical protein [Gemmatimonadota bacterium]